MSTFTWIPDHGAAQSFKTDVNRTEFGDGYSQRSANGINSTSENWDIRFTVRTRTEINAIITFLKARAGVSNFTWTTPEGVARKFVCSEWKSSYMHAGDASLSTTFEQDFGP